MSVEQVCPIAGHAQQIHPVPDIFAGKVSIPPRERSTPPELLIDLLGPPPLPSGKPEWKPIREKVGGWKKGLGWGSLTGAAATAALAVAPGYIILPVLPVVAGAGALAGWRRARDHERRLPLERIRQAALEEVETEVWTRYERAYALWQAAHYCQRHDVVILPNQPQALEPHEFHAAVHSPAALP